MFRTVADQVSLWEAVLPAELLRLPEELARVDEWLDDEAFFGLFEEFLDPRIGRPSTPMEVYLRLMFLKFRYRLGYETLCREVSDSFTWRRFCRIPFDGAVPHPTTPTMIADDLSDLPEGFDRESIGGRQQRPEPRP